METSIFRELVNIVKQNKQTVHVEIGLCDVTRDREFVTVVKEIKSAPQTFSVVWDLKWDRSGDRWPKDRKVVKEFVFKTIKNKH